MATEIRAADALLIGELESTYISSHTKDPNSPESPQPERLVITTPNADYLPFIDLGRRIVLLKSDGRWGAEDWAQWPQWFFDEYDHFPYVLRRPKPEELATHPLRRIWWTMGEGDFMEEKGCGLEGIGRLAPQIAEEFHVLHLELIKRITASDCNRIDEHFRKLYAAATALQRNVSLLCDTPQTFVNVFVTVATVQRFYLETRALLDKIEKWDPLVTFGQKYKVNLEIIGTITDRLGLAYELFDKGVPVWLVRTPALIPQTISIVRQTDVTKPSPSVGVVVDPWPEAPPYYSGILSPVMYAGSSKWKPGTIDLSHVGPEALPRPKPAPESVIEYPAVPQKDAMSRPSSREPSQTDRASPQTVQSSSRLQKDRAQRYTPYQKPATKPTHQSINFERFRTSTSPFSSQPLPEWENALRSVNTDLSRLVDHPQKQLFKGYAFPDSLTFIGDGLRDVEMLLAWLIIRTSWMASLVSFTGPHRQPLPNPQQWRTYLRNIALDLQLVRPDERRQHILQSPPPEPSKINRSTRRGQKMKDMLKDIFTNPKPTSVSSIQWNDRVVWRPGSITLDRIDRQLAAWDIHDHNFRFELYALDQCVMQSTDRWPRLAGVFPEETLLVDPLPTSMPRITSEDWRERCPYLDVFRSVLAEWPGEVPRQLADMKFGSKEDDHIVWDRDRMCEVEKLAYGFYSQTFFDYFGRAPAVPHTLPRADI
ncbi:hypothetical protein P691DRAFT_777636 [Macrolepiota fuliginosa MF-IS2]|uniref:Uncharacterized protein n=1 Tax=Macrolepiota fuliginosa MF-IS2 TaxID=1400762 RepID=A0A9P6C173_9AGAR|nr:hypothetical protein P691DRAFT_777636 [Macrolepiota fuliginosa MF-IS2]